MSRTDSPPKTHRGEEAGRRERTLAAAVLAAIASFVALWPYTSVVVAGSWTMSCVSVILVVSIVGFIVRLLRSGRADRAWSALTAQVVTAIMTITVLTMPQGALLGAIPTSTTLTSLRSMSTEAFEQVQYGTAPVEDTAALRTMLALGFGVVAILLDQLISQRVTLLATILVAAVGATPMIITGGDANVLWFVMLALLTLFLLRYGVRHDPTAPKRASLGVMISVGAAAIIAALVITPALPVSASWVGGGTSVQVNPTLRLGDDLRRPTPFDVMTLATKAGTAPYLRVASLSQFDGEVWAPDETDLQPISDGFGEPDWGEDIETLEKRTSIRVTGISSSLLPVPYPATKVVGLSSAWRVMPENRTVVSSAQDAAGQDYTVTTETAEPTREQIQAATTARAPAPSEELPAVIAETARQVTADAATDYDKLVTLQNWFRSQFTYSLEAPVDGGFDGTGAEAVAEFLDVRSGYCVHFSGAFALMAQTLDMQVRIVVGYLPGRATEEKRGSETIFVVSSEQLHAWPEVHFEGIGWVPFEPTASLGVPTNFQSANSPGGSSSGPAAPAPSAEPSALPTSGPEIDRDEAGSSTADGQPLRRLDPAPVMLVTAGVLLALLLPALIRLAVRLRRHVRARRGDAMIAWRELRDTLVDLRLPVSDADSPRARGAALVERGADPAMVRVLVDAVERESYARSAQDAGGDLSAALTHISADLRRSVDLRVRVAAVLLPRALFAGRETRIPELS